MSTSKPPAHSPNPQPAPKDAPPAYKPIKWSFPFAPAGKDDAGSPMTYMKALGNAEDGFYPLGVNGMWHGGIHFGHETAQLLKQDEGVRAIADGEVVAYRLNRRYPEFQYDDHKWALYSTGFVLVRHRLQLPPSPKKNGSTSASTAAPADEQLTFFSLYMHLLDWDGYQATVQQAKGAPANAGRPAMAPMKYWDGDRWYRVGDSAKDMQEVPKPTPQPPVTDPDPLQRLLDPDYTPPPQPAAPPEPPPPPPIAGVRVFDAANGRVIGLLPKGAELTVGPEKDGWARIATMKSGRPVGPMAGQSASANVACGWVNLKSLELIVNPHSFDQVVVLKSPVSIDAGEVVGYLGHYLRHGDATLLPAKRTRPLVHVEVFAGSDLPAFIAKSKARGAELKEQTFLEVQPGAQLITKVVDPTPLMLKPGLKLVPMGDAQGAAWVQVQPKLITAAPATHGKHKGHQKQRETPEGKPVWVESNLANQTTTGQERGWVDFPPSLSTVSGPAAEFRDVFRRTDLDALGQGRLAKDSQGRCWWYITLAKKDGGTVDGWVCEKDHRLTQWCGPWDWPGFEQVDGSSYTPLDLLRRYLFTRQLILADEDQEKFKASALEVNEGPLIKQLTKAIDANHDGNVTAQELARAQQVQWSAEAISHLVVRCESEWGGGMGKWDSLSPLMQRLLCHWKSEMQRIETLQWWDSAKGIDGFPQDTKPWHFHPIGLVGNFRQNACSCGRDITEEELDSILPPDVLSKGLFYKSDDRSVRCFDKGEFLRILNLHMRQNDMQSCVRKAHFLSQMVHECDELRTNEEYRNKDGSIPSGWYSYHGGPNYHGRGLIQLTHVENYEGFGSAVGNTGIGSGPERVSHSLDLTVQSACWYWRSGSKWGDINPKADRNDFYAITLAVNGGFVHVADRFLALNRLAKLLGVHGCVTNPGLVFSDYNIESSSVYGTRYYKSHVGVVRSAVEAVNSVKAKI